MATWDESKHKRDKDGKFVEKVGQKEYQAEVAKATLKEKGVNTDKLSDEKVLAKRDEIVGKTGRFETESGKEIKKPFINIQLFHAKDYSGWGTREMKKSIRSHNKTIALHEDKIKNPEKYYPDEWNKYNEELKQKHIQNWEKEIRNYKKNIVDIEKELKKRGEL